MTTTEQDARALMYLARRIREDTPGAGQWDEPGLWSELRTLVGQHLAITCDRVLRHAADPDARTPGAIRRPFTPGPPTAGPRFPARPGEDCQLHPGEHADACRSCAADRLAGDGPTPPPDRARRTESRISELRDLVQPTRTYDKPQEEA